MVLPGYAEDDGYVLEHVAKGCAFLATQFAPSFAVAEQSLLESGLDWVARETKLMVWATLENCYYFEEVGHGLALEDEAVFETLQRAAVGAYSTDSATSSVHFVPGQGYCGGADDGDADVSLQDQSEQSKGWLCADRLRIVYLEWQMSKWCVLYLTVPVEERGVACKCSASPEH